LKFLFFSLCPEEIFSKELVMFGVCTNPYTMARAVALADNMGKRYLDLKKLGVETFKLEDYEAAMAKLKTGEISKAVFEF
jgi:D-arabinitol dehydrogenase (NADP+)